jgi:5'-3' exonuclease
VDVEVHLIDGTYELFRHYFALPSALDDSGHEIAALRGVLASLAGMIDSGATHLGVATDHVIESFRNEMFPGYKTAAGIDLSLLSQFEPLEQALDAMGLMVWPMSDQEADDALAAAAQRASKDRRVDRVLICTPDKDLAQCVEGDRVVQLDRRRQQIRNEAGVWERFGVAPKSIPDYLALVGDTADGIPGLPGWGAKSTAAVLAQYPHLEDIPEDQSTWGVPVRNATKLAQVLFGRWEDAVLFRTLATLRTDAQVFNDVEALSWRGARPDFEVFCRSMRAGDLWEKVERLRSRIHG